MAVLKHIKSRNADYSAAIDYLLFQHDEKTGKKILDEFDRSILREEFYMDGLNVRSQMPGFTKIKNLPRSKVIITSSALILQMHRNVILPEKRHRHFVWNLRKKYSPVIKHWL